MVKKTTSYVPKIQDYTYKMKVCAGKGNITGNIGHAQQITMHLTSDSLDKGRFFIYIELLQ